MPDRSRSPVHASEPLRRPPDDYAEEERDTWGWRTTVYPGEPLRRPPRDYAEDAIRRPRRRVWHLVGWTVFFGLSAATPIVFAIVLFLIWRHS